MKAISLWQPWAQWVAFGWKTIEIRDHHRFANLVGQRIAIHAAKRWDMKAWGMARAAGAPVSGPNIMKVMAMRVKAGAILCTADVINIAYPDDLLHNRERIEGWQRRAMSPIDGKHLYFIDLISRLPDSVPFKGRQGIFDVPDELVR